MEKDKTLNPVGVSLLGADAEALHPNKRSHLIKQFWLRNCHDVFSEGLGDAFS